MVDSTDRHGSIILPMYLTDVGGGTDGMTWAQSIANEKLSIFAEGTRVAKGHKDKLKMRK